jgi:hypothetical protein
MSKKFPKITFIKSLALFTLHDMNVVTEEDPVWKPKQNENSKLCE